MILQVWNREESSHYRESQNTLSAACRDVWNSKIQDQRLWLIYNRNKDSTEGMKHMIGKDNVAKMRNPILNTRLMLADGLENLDSLLLELIWQLLKTNL